MIIAGPSVRNGGRRVGALVNSADLFSTILELAGVDVAATLPKEVQIDSRSLVPYLSNPDQKPIREWIYADHFGPNVNAQKEGQAMRNDRYKIIHFGNGNKALFDMHEDPWEKKNLLDGGVGSLSAEAKANYDLLEKTIKELLASKK
jgi:arylsulfatase A-like enzyme